MWASAFTRQAFSFLEVSPTATWEGRHCAHVTDWRSEISHWLHVIAGDNPWQRNLGIVQEGTHCTWETDQIWNSYNSTFSCKSIVGWLGKVHLNILVNCSNVATLYFYIATNQLLFCANLVVTNTFNVHLYICNLVPRAPPHFLREKPWGRGWYIWSGMLVLRNFRFYRAWAF